MFKKVNGLALFVLIATLFLFNGCNLPGSKAPQEENPPEALLTQAAKTVVAELTLSAPLPATNTQTTIKEEPSEQPAEMITPSPQETSTEETQPQPNTPTQTPENEFPVISAKVNTNCRAGADSSFDILGYLLVDETSNVHGQDPWGYWWYIENPDHPGKFCWIWRETTEVEGDTTNVPVIQPPPTYTPTNTPTFTPSPTVGTAYP
ncbi:MAG TPA: hypothetical protein G4N95_00555 [Anaerolineae bacterium]|nr:hypothetical protein [Anaerolineae bacterium]